MDTAHGIALPIGLRKRCYRGRNRQPNTMKAAYIQQTGPPQNIVFGDLPPPQPGPGQCLVKVGAVSVNPIDTYIRAGLVPMKLPNPFVVGCDLAGTVMATGHGVTRFRTGDRVWGSNQGLLGRQGTFAEFAAVDEAWLHPVPGGVSDEQAAANALVGITAHLGLVRHAGLQAGEILFVNGGTGGVGSVVVQMAKALGARVVTTAGSPDKVQACRQLGADLALNYKTDDVAKAVLQFAPKGVNVWWETLREPDFERTLPLLAPRGRMILMAGREARPVFPVGPFYVKDCSLHGFAMFNATPDEQRECARDINRWHQEGKLQPRIDRVLPLAETAAAHQLQEDNTIRKAGTLAGKIVLKP
jgi:NADPH2:quinone reductase